MTNIELSESSRQGSSRRRNRSSAGTSSQSGINSLLSWALLIVVIFSPLPLGSNRPIFWGLWSIYIAVVGIIYFSYLALNSEKLRISPAKLGAPMALFVITCLFLLIQVLPIGSFPIQLPDGTALDYSRISVAPAMTNFMLARQLSFGLLFLLMIQVSVNDNRRILMQNLIMLSVVGYGIYGLISLQTGDTILGMQKWAYIGSATGPFVNRNSFATYLGFGAVIALANAGAHVIRRFERHSHDGRIRNNTSNILLYLLAYATLLVVIIATQSRMGLFSTLCGSLVVVLLTANAIRNIKILLYLVPILVLILGAALLLFGDGLFERIGGVEFSAEIRTNLYRQVIELISLRPWTGFGGGSFELAFPLVHKQPVSPDYLWEKGHNTYLTLWAEMGLIFGSLPIIGLMLVGAKMLSGLVKRQGSWTAQTIGVAVLSIGAIHSLTDFSLEIQADTFLFIALIAAGVATTLTLAPLRTE